MKVFYALLFSFSVPVFGSSEFYSLSRSIRALGMGGAFYGLSNDENALFYNPAGLGFYERGSDFMLSFKAETSTSMLSALSVVTRSGTRSTAQVISDLETFQGSPLTFAATPFFAYYLRKYFAMGFFFGDTKGELNLLGKDIDTSVSLTGIIDSGVLFGGAFPVAKDVMVGFNLKGLLRAGGTKTYSVLDIASGVSTDFSSVFGSGAGLDLDLGAMWQLPELVPGVTTRVSLSLNNLVASRFDLIRIRTGSNSVLAPQLARTVTLAGHARFPGFWKADHVDLVVDLADFGLGGQSDPELGARTGSLWKHVNLGVEVPFRGWLFARMGLRQGNFTFGAGIDARYFQIDFATYAEEMASLPGRLSSRRLALRIAAGLGGPMPTVPSATETTVPEGEGARPKAVPAQKPAA
jgi:hypothetical protein